MKLLFFSGPTCSKCKIVYTWWNDFVINNSWLDFEIVDTSLSLEEAKKYGVHALPSFVLVNKDDEFVHAVFSSSARGDVEMMVAKYRG